MKKTFDSLKKLLSHYYTDLYKNKLSLVDWQWRVKNRLNEDSQKSYYTAMKNIEKIKKLINISFNKKTKVLVVGAGTGVEMVQLAKDGCQVYGIEPDNQAVEILKLRAELKQIENEKIVKGVAEKIPFKDNCFDFIYCWQVLEHVQDPEKSIKEMIRVTKLNGYIFIGFPDYRQIVEPHYKIYLPLFLPKIFSRLWLKLRRRNTAFFDSLQFVTSKKIRNILRKNNVTAMQIIEAYDVKEIKIRDLKKLMYWIQDNLEIEQNQFWLIKKN